MRFGRGKPTRIPAEPPHDLANLCTWFAAADRATKASVVAALVMAVRPFGSLDRHVIEPARLESLADGVLAALGAASSDTGSIVSELESLPAVVAGEEPDGLGFYALGAAVEILYAARFAQGDDGSASHALSRALDLIDSADDELGTDLTKALVESLCRYAALPDVGPLPTPLLDRLRAQAAQLA